MDGNTCEIKMHYKKKKSIYKNEKKIAETDESFLKEENNNSYKRHLLNKEDLEISFLFKSWRNVTKF